MQRIEFSAQKIDRSFAKYSGGTLQVSGTSWFRKLKLCWFEEEKLSGLASFSFELFEVLEMLEIKKSDIESEWSTLTNGIALIPSENFKKLTIITDSPLNSKHLEQLTDALGLLKQKIAVEVRCKRLNLEPVLSYPSSNLEFGRFKGFRSVLDLAGEQKHFKLMGDSVEHRIDLFIRELTFSPIKLI
jgi:hypothetical protein